MNETAEKQGSGRRMLLAIAAVFLVPLAIAVWLYYGGSNFVPEGRTNSGALLTPIINLNDHRSDFSTALTGDRWALVYLNREDCAEACREALYKMRQSRLMLGNDMTRVVRIFLHGDNAPDRVFLDGEHAGLLTTSDADLGTLLDRKRPQDLLPGGLYLIDPLGNLVMYFAADLEPHDMVEDIEHLLDVSRIG